MIIREAYVFSDYSLSRDRHAEGSFFSLFSNIELVYKITYRSTKSKLNSLRRYDSILVSRVDHRPPLSLCSLAYERVA